MPARPSSPRRSLPVLFSVVILDLIGFGIAIPVLPFYAEDFGANGMLLGLVLTAYAGAQFLFAPLWGRLSDRIGRRPVMLMTIAGTSAALIWVGLVGSLAQLVAARFASGAFAANVSVASAYIADVTDESERTRWMGMIGASFAIGFVLGPAIGGLLSVYGHDVPMLAAGGLAAVNLVYAAFALHEPPGHEPAAARSGSRFEVLRDPVVLRVCGVNLIFALAVTQLESMFAFFMLHRFGYTALQVAGILIGMAVVMGGIQGGGMKALSARFSNPALLVGGSALLAVGVGFVPLMPTVALLLVPLAAAAAGRAVAQPPLMSMASLAAAPADRGRVMGAFQSAASAARVIGPFVAGTLFDLSEAAPFYLASALLVVVAVRGRAFTRAVPDGLAAGEPAPPAGPL